MKLGDLACQAHLLQIADGTRGQAVATWLVAGEFGLVEDHNLGAGLRGLPRGGRTRGPATRDDQVVSLRHTSLSFMGCRTDITQGDGSVPGKQIRLASVAKLDVAGRSEQVSDVRAVQ
jgi:hypothetical protein